MAEETEKSGAEAAAKPEGTPDTKSQLPAVESPSISPANPETAQAPSNEPVAAISPIVEPITDSPIAPVPPAGTSFRLRARHKLLAALAASVVFAAAIGVLVGMAASGGFKKPEAPRVDAAAIAEQKAMNQSIARLNKEVSTLRANLDAANKAAHSQMAKLSERLTRERAEITGSISAPQTTTPKAAAPAPALSSAPASVPAAQATAPLPTPRPQTMAAIEPPSARPAVVRGWSIRDSRDGYVYVQNRGEIYQVVPGAPLPGLGPVEQIKRQSGRWVVVTPKGLIVSARDRDYFE